MWSQRKAEGDVSREGHIERAWFEKGGGEMEETAVGSHWPTPA